MYQAKTWLSGDAGIPGSLSLDGAVRQLCRAAGYAIDAVYTVSWSRGSPSISRWNVFLRMDYAAGGIIGVVDFVDLTAP